MVTIEARMEIVNESLLQMVAVGHGIQMMKRMVMKIRKEVRIQITTPTKTKKVTILTSLHFSTAKLRHYSL
jgi:hypothetical protein